MLPLFRCAAYSLCLWPSRSWPSWSCFVADMVCGRYGRTPSRQWSWLKTSLKAENMVLVSHCVSLTLVVAGLAIVNSKFIGRRISGFSYILITLFRKWNALFIILLCHHALLLMADINNLGFEIYGLGLLTA